MWMDSKARQANYNAALDMVVECGRVGRITLEQKADYFDCPEIDTGDAYQNLIQSARAVCKIAGVTERDYIDAFEFGWYKE